jgi:hypothetical protein
MNNWTGLWQKCGGAIVVTALTVLPAEAQIGGVWEDRGFVNVSGGVQPTGRTHVNTGQFDLYDELGSFDATLKTTAGGIFDIQTGVRVFENVLVAVAYTRYSDTLSAFVNARVPDPLYVDTFADSTSEVGSLTHTEHGVHMSAGYMMLLPELPKLRLLFHAGPTVFSLDKEVVTGVSVTPGTQTVDGVKTQSVSGTALGVHFGADVQYMFTPQFGAGLLLRWSGGSVDVPQIDGGEVTVGGLSIAGGIRYSF